MWPELRVEFKIDRRQFDADQTPCRTVDGRLVGLVSPGRG